jgi:hypothetical protein
MSNYDTLIRTTMTTTPGEAMRLAKQDIDSYSVSSRVGRDASLHDVRSARVNYGEGVTLLAPTSL